MLLAGISRPMEQNLLAIIADRLGEILWRAFGGEGSSAPRSLYALLNDLPEQDSCSVQSYSTPEDFEAARSAAQGGEANGDRTG